MEVFYYIQKESMNTKSKEQRIIAGPCALESHEHAQITSAEAKKSGVNAVRMNLWKPRTKPGYEGVGEAGIPWAREAAEAGLTVAMEAILPEHAELVMNEILGKVPHATLMLWIGSRNQNHLLQREIAETVAGEERVQLLVKNQPWRDERHWVGIVDHVVSGGVDPEQILLVHRGFTPWDASESPMRNIHDLEMARRVKEELGLPLLLDPSHIGGTVALVKELATQYSREPWIDGQLIEVHPNPPEAITDRKQQLSWDELRKLALL